MASILHTNGAVWIWNSYTGNVDNNGNPRDGAFLSGDGYQMSDGDVVLLSFDDGTGDKASSPFWIAYDNGVDPPADYAITYGMDTTGDTPTYSDLGDANNPGEVEVDPDAVDNYEQYYDEGDGTAD